jgi:hypothetical protein
MGKTHFWQRSEDNVKPGDVIKYYDELTLDERLALNDIRALGESRVLDEKASMLEDLAAAARHRANVRKRLDLHPWLDQEPAVVRPTYALAQLGLTAFCLCMLVALFMQVWSGRDRASAAEAPSPPPSMELQNAHPGESGESKRATRSRKGGAEVANVW